MLCSCWDLAKGRKPICGDAISYSYKSWNAKGSSCGPWHEKGDSKCWAYKSK